MNKDRRKQIAKASASVAEALELIAGAKEVIENCRDEEQDFLDNMPENLQDGEKGQAAQSAIDQLEEALGAIEEFESSDIEGFLRNAAE